ncbi:Rv3654c family TadE-like protein [Herbidospora daliensis]|uniref:Rv3654c family TadE-like protein n=1 Tax=Herbidospora daliensis TaxID=295585 RepID=UPI0007C69442|nr:Rv3654c family TadE-like protein [Herbidospora daliensis]
MVRAQGDRRDRGSATVWVVAVMVLVWGAAYVLVQVGMARVAVHAARTAADLGALAAAQLALAAPQQACGRAAEVVVANDARVVSCEVENGVSKVTAGVRLRFPGFDEREASATSRAGPVYLDAER